MQLHAAWTYIIVFIENYDGKLRIPWKLANEVETIKFFKHLVNFCTLKSYRWRQVRGLWSVTRKLERSLYGSACEVLAVGKWRMLKNQKTGILSYEVGGMCCVVGWTKQTYESSFKFRALFKKLRAISRFKAVAGPVCNAWRVWLSMCGATRGDSPFVVFCSLASHNVPETPVLSAHQTLQ